MNKTIWKFVFRIFANTIIIVLQIDISMCYSSIYYYVQELSSGFLTWGSGCREEHPKSRRRSNSSLIEQGKREKEGPNQNEREKSDPFV